VQSEQSGKICGSNFALILLDKPSDTVYLILKRGEKIRSVIDTNIIFAGLYSNQGASFQVLRAIASERIQPVISVALLFEYEDVLKRNSRKLGFTYDEIDAFLDNICNLSVFQKIHYLWRPFLPDPKDDHVFELAVASQTDIATFNAKDFKNADQFGIKIITPGQLLERIKWEH
jgi:putative PIN family toxin of toxin-antitoxin system